MITLSKDMEVGVAKIDSQHKILIDRINDVTSMGTKSVSKEETQKTLKLLSDYVVKHFTDEEAIHIQSKYPKYDFHKNQHQLFIKELQRIEKEFAENGPSPKFTLDLSHYVIKWIVGHIKSSDVEFGKYYKTAVK